MSPSGAPINLFAMDFFLESISAASCASKRTPSISGFAKADKLSLVDGVEAQPQPHKQKSPPGGAGSIRTMQ